MQIRTDLAMESGAAAPMQGVVMHTQRRGSLEETAVTVESPQAARALGKPCGTYITLYHPHLIHAQAEDRLELSRGVARAARSMLPPVRGRLRGVCAAAPGVLGVTGMETAEMVHGIVERVRPAAVIAIDALAARESGRICTTVQITDTGIRPGSGVGNHRVGLTRDTLGVPVIAVGVPMVVYAAVIARDALSLLLEDIGLKEEEHAQAVDQLIAKVIREGLGELVVTPREVDEMVGRVARIIADGLNIALQPELSEEEIFLLSHDRA